MIRSTGAPSLLVAPSAGQVIASNVASRSNLSDRPCRVSDDSLNKHVVFKARVSRDFWYPPGRSPTKLFVIRLEGCRATAVGKVVTLAFKGTERAAFPGHLKATGVNVSQLGITLLDVDDSSLLKPDASHNKGQGERVTGSSLKLSSGAYVVAVPKALQTKSVVLGDYEVTATFKLTCRQQNFCTGYLR